MGCCLAFLTALYGPTVVSIVRTLPQDPFGHGYFVLAGAGYLAWSRRERLDPIEQRPAFAALVPVGLLSSLWLLSNLAGILSVQQVCLVALFAAVTWAVLGGAAARTLAFPLGLLFFAVPFGGPVAAALQEFTARFALAALTLSGAHATLEGSVIAIGDARWQITEGCGGINYLVASLAVGYLYAGSVYRQWGHRVTFVVASAVVPIAANGLRVYTTILLDYLGAARVAAGMGHYMYGLLVFGIVMSILFITCGRWREEPVIEPSRASGSERGIAVMPPAAPGRTVLCGTIAILLAAMGPISMRLVALPPGADTTIRYGPPSVSPPWKIADGGSLAWSPRFVTPQAEFLQTYKSGNGVVKLYVARYGTSQSDVKVASRSNLLYDEQWWPDRERRRTILWNGQLLEVNEQLLRSPQSSMLVWNWYEVDGRFTADRYVAKLRLAGAMLLRSRKGSAAFAVATEEQRGVDAVDVLRSFLRRVSVSGLAGG